MQPHEPGPPRRRDLRARMDAAIPSPPDEMHYSASESEGSTATFSPPSLERVIPIAKALPQNEAWLAFILTSLELWSDRFVLRHVVIGQARPFAARGPDDVWRITDDKGHRYECQGGGKRGTTFGTGDFIFRPSVAGDAETLSFELRMAGSAEPIEFTISLTAAIESEG